MHALTSFVVAALLIAAPVRADDKTAEIDRIFAQFTPETPGCACAVSHDGKVVMQRAYGLADLENKTPIRAETIFDAGSVTKQFVAAAVLMLVEDQRLALTDDVRTHIPELPDMGHVVTIDHLLTHTGGIRDWTGILPLAAKKEDALTLTLRQRGLNFVPGEEFSYSNSGYVLLKEIVNRVSGTTFAEFARQRLFEPLGMKATSYRYDLAADMTNRALAYQKSGDGWTLGVLIDNERGGGGGLLTTPLDLLRWNDALTNQRLGAFVTAKLQEPARLDNGRTLGYARGLFLDDRGEGPVIWHGGSAGAYKTVLARYPKQKLSIAIMCNAGDSEEGATALARHLYNLYVPADPAAEAKARAMASPGDSVAGVDARAGLYFSETTHEPLRLAEQRGRLRIAGGPALISVAKDRFRRQGTSLMFLSGDAFELHFTSPDAFELRSMEGKVTRYRRAQPWSPSAADLQALAGRYESPEIGATFQVTSGDAGIVVGLEHMPERTLEFKPIDTDAFQRANVLLRFVRDAAGKVVALDYSNPVVRHVAFTRRSDDVGSR